MTSFVQARSGLYGMHIRPGKLQAPGDACEPESLLQELLLRVWPRTLRGPRQTSAMGLIVSHSAGLGVDLRAARLSRYRFQGSLRLKRIGYKATQAFLNADN